MFTTNKQKTSPVVNHEGFCSPSILQGHAPGAKLLLVYQRFHGYTSSSGAEFPKPLVCIGLKHKIQLDSRWLIPSYVSVTICFYKTYLGSYTEPAGHLVHYSHLIWSQGRIIHSGRYACLTKQNVTEMSRASRRHHLYLRSTLHILALY